MLIVILLTICFFCGSVNGIGIGSSLSRIKLEVHPGEEAVSNSLKLINPDPATKKFILSLRKGTVEKGYSNIENLMWIDIAPETIIVLKNDKSEPIKITISIPDSLKYYNRRFGCFLDISQVGSGGLSTGLVIPIMIDTAPTREIHKRCKGCGLLVYPHKLNILGKVDSITVVNWSDDSMKIAVGWNDVGHQNWKDALILLQNILGVFVPLPDTFIVMPNEKSNIYIKPVAFPGRGKLYFSSGEMLDFVNIEWSEY